MRECATFLIGMDWGEGSEAQRSPTTLPVPVTGVAGSSVRPPKPRTPRQQACSTARDHMLPRQTLSHFTFLKFSFPP